MQFTGTNLVSKRSFYTQSGQFGAIMTVTVDNTSGLYQFGLSGAQGVLEFKLQSGKMYYDGQFVHAYAANQQFIVEGQWSRDGENVIKDGAPLVYSGVKPTGLFDTFYMKRENAGMGATFNVDISGNNIPSYIIQSQGYLYVSGQASVTGYFLNQGAYPIRVFNSSIVASQNYTAGALVATISGGASGAYTYSGNFDSLDLSQPILTSFNTNFGDVSTLFYITDTRTLATFVQFGTISNFTFNSTGILNRDLSYINYSGGFATNAFNTFLTFTLQSGSGNNLFTGAWDILTGLTPTTLFSIKQNPNVSARTISGSGTFQPNSTVNFQVTHLLSGTDQIILTISGSGVTNGISQTISVTT